MGYKVKTRKKLIKTGGLFASLILLAFAIWYTLPNFSLIMHKLYPYQIKYFVYNPSSTIVPNEAYNANPAQAVPILIYHGVTETTDSENTTLTNFISQMEMLKTHGYKTITLDDLYNFLYGDFVLPSKPIIITFDDGRKDSYYPTDSVFEKLGFKATIFIVGGKSNEKNKFFLSWKELREMRDSGRWDIQAHGTNSHQKILINKNGDHGKFLTSKVYQEKSGLESDENYKSRVEKDYIQNIYDIKNMLGIDAKYYAIPFNEYGSVDSTNFPPSSEINDEFVRKFFKLSFIEGYVYDAERPYSIIYGTPLYNYIYTDPYRVVRIEPKNMPADDLKNLLDGAAPQAFPFVLERDAVLDISSYRAFGTLQHNGDNIILTTEIDKPSTKVVFGDLLWKNYTAEAVIELVTGRSVILTGYDRDNDNYLSLGIDASGFYLSETTSGYEKTLKRISTTYTKTNNIVTLKLKLENGLATGYLNDKALIQIQIKNHKYGRVGVKIWDPEGKSSVIIKSLTVTSNPSSVGHQKVIENPAINS